MAMTRLAAKLMMTGIPQYQIAAAIRVSPSKLSEYKNGRLILPTRVLVSLTMLLKCNPDELRGWTDDADVVCLEDGIDTALVRDQDALYASPIKYA